MPQYSGARNSNWKGGASVIPVFCIDCNKQLKNYNSRRCRSCSNKVRNHYWGGKISAAKKGRCPQHKGEFKGFRKDKPRSAETIEKARQSMLKRFEDKTKHPRWQGGKSFEPYPVGFDGRLKRHIRDRDNNSCQLCFEFGDNVHHVDYNKQNCDESNLITLCRSCHVRTNGRREEWKRYFQALIAASPELLGIAVSGVYNFVVVQ